MAEYQGQNAPRADEVGTGALGLPYSLEAEQAILGAVLLEPATLNEVADTLREEHFYLPEHRAIYRVMMAKLLAAGERLDFVTVLESLKADGYFAGEDGKAYLLSLAQMLPSVSGARRYAGIVREKYDVRRLIQTSRAITEDALEPGVEADDLLDSAEQRIYEIRGDRQSGGLVPLRDVILSVYDNLTKLNSDERWKYIGIPSGLSALDELTTGLNRSDLIIVGARPGMGKTSFALNLARNAAVQQGKTVAFFSLEMSREQLASRLLSVESGVSGKKLRTGVLSTDEWSRLAMAASQLYGMPIFLDDTSSIKVSDMKARLRRMKGVDLVVVDYLQLMQSSRRTENRVTEVSDITRNLKIMAKELHVPLLVCAQLSRSTDKNTKNHRPGLSDLRESGSIEQDADQVLFLYRDDYYIAQADDPSQVEHNVSEVIVAKNRHGELGTVKLAWSGETTRFTSLETHYGT